MKNLLIFGSNGFIGKKLLKKIRNKYNCICFGGSKDLDFTNPDLGQLSKKINQKIDGILFLQGKSPKIGFQDIEKENFVQMFSVDIITPFLIVRELSRLEMLSKDASLVFLSSVAVKKGSYDPSYACSKSSMEGLVRVIRRNISDVRANIITLGLVEKSPVHVGMTEDFVELHRKRMGGKLVQVEDVISSIEYLLTNNSVNGIFLEVTSGFSV
jgi:NAD(P)-dependent dehydrogenase (short-subunit alcohol dehydrogenase family)